MKFTFVCKRDPHIKGFNAFIWVMMNVNDGCHKWLKHSTGLMIEVEVPFIPLVVVGAIDNLGGYSGAEDFLCIQTACNTRGSINTIPYCIVFLLKYSKPKIKKTRLQRIPFRTTICTLE